MELLEKLPELISQYGGYLATAAIVILELIGRKWPTTKPMSILAITARIVRGAASILDSISNVLDKVVKDEVKP